jgi:NADH-quinone oxidoreductase subunit F
MRHIIDRIHDGDASWNDVELLNDVALQIKGKCLCALGEFSIEAVTSGIERFESDFRTKVSEANIDDGTVDS